MSRSELCIQFTDSIMNNWQNITNHGIQLHLGWISIWIFFMSQLEKTFYLQLIGYEFTWKNSGDVNIFITNLTSKLLWISTKNHQENLCSPAKKWVSRKYSHKSFENIKFSLTTHHNLLSLCLFCYLFTKWWNCS